MSFMITTVHSGWEFTMHSSNGAQYNLAYFVDKTTTFPNILGAWHIALISPTAQTTRGASIRVTEWSNIQTDGTIGKWMDWTFVYCSECESGSGTWVTASVNGGAAVKLMIEKSTILTNAKFGVTSISENCATADFQYFMKNIAVYEGENISKDVMAADFGYFKTSLGTYTGTTKYVTYDPSLYNIYPTYPTNEPFASLSKYVTTTAPTTTSIAALTTTTVATTTAVTKTVSGCPLIDYAPKTACTLSSCPGTTTLKYPCVGCACTSGTCCSGLNLECKNGSCSKKVVRFLEYVNNIQTTKSTPQVELTSSTKNLRNLREN